MPGQIAQITLDSGAKAVASVDRRHKKSADPGRLTLCWLERLASPNGRSVDIGSQLAVPEAVQAKLRRLSPEQDSLFPRKLLIVRHQQETSIASLIKANP